MKEKLMMIKDKVIAYAKKVYRYFKSNLTATGILMFSVVSLILILIAMFAMNEFVVSVCGLIILEAGMAALLHKAELWKHGVLLAAQIVAALIIGRLPLVILCVISYVAATFALQLITKGNKAKAN